MARDFENMDDLSDLNDDELRGVVQDRLAGEDALDADDITVTASQGRVRLEGRVGTDGERQIADHVLSDGLGMTDFVNNLVVDPMRRAENPEAADEQASSTDADESPADGARGPSLHPEYGDRADDLDAELYGTSDVGQAIEEGTPWVPPDGPTPEGRSESTDRIG